MNDEKIRERIAMLDQNLQQQLIMITESLVSKRPLCDMLEEIYIYYTIDERLNELKILLEEGA